MEAYICDRCGKSFPIRNKVTFHAFRLTEDGVNSIRPIGCRRLKNVDLCPVCILALDSFVDDYEDLEERMNK